MLEVRERLEAGLDALVTAIATFQRRLEWLAKHDAALLAVDLVRDRPPACGGGFGASVRMQQERR